MTMTAPQSQQQPPRPREHLGEGRRHSRSISIWDPAIARRAVGDSFRKLDPRVQLRNPVMFVVGVGAAVTTVEFLRSLVDASLAGDRFFTAAVAVWLWFTVLFAHFAEALAPGRGEAQADTP